MQLTEIKLNERNPRKINNYYLGKLKKSIKEFPEMLELRPIIIDKNNVVIAGNMRVRALEELGYTEIPDKWVIRAENLTPEKIQELIIKDNLSYGQWDYKILAEDWKLELLEYWGMDTKEIEKLKVESISEAKEDVPTITTVRSREGDLYVIGGKHYLFCGDATERESYRVFPRKARMVITDPPYSVQYKWRKRPTKKILNDKQDDEELRKFYKGVAQNLFFHTTTDAVFYWFFATSKWEINRLALEEAGWYVSQPIIWIKERFALSMGKDFSRTLEPIFTGWKRGAKHFINKNFHGKGIKDIWELRFDDFQALLDAWYIARENVTQYVHPTQKPVKLYERAILRSSELGDSILDPFGGSGTILLACERAKRIALSMEFDLEFCDVILRRYKEQYPDQEIKEINNNNNWLEELK